MHNKRMDFDVVGEMTRVLTLEGESILNCALRLKAEPLRTEVKRAVTYFQKALDQSGKIIVTGVGKSGKVGQKIAATLCSTGSLAVFLHPTEGLHGDLGLVSPLDVVLALSYTGNTDEVVQLIPPLKSLNVSLIGMGGNPQSQLAQKSDVWIDASVEVEACPHNLAPTTSTTLALALGDAFAVALMKLRGFDRLSFAQNHPGGALGRRMNLRVSDVMHQGEALAVLGPSATMDEVVVALTQKKLGGALIVEDSRLLGLITDGDLRRALKYREKFFQMKASEIMTRNPVVVNSRAPARLALDLMENRPRQISVLPVVDEETGHWKGIVRVHDLVKTL